MNNSVLAKKIEKQLQVVNDLKNQLTQAESYLKGLQDAYGFISSSNNTAKKEFALRAGSDLEKVKIVLEESKKPLHIDDILQKIGKESKSKVSLAGSLSGYARDGKIFRKIGPNKFGLIEQNHKNLPETADTVRDNSTDSLMDKAT